MSKKLNALLFTLLIVINIFLHILLIDKPEQPVFDEHHFATYAANYASGRAFFDIHPPLGKLIYALPLVLFAEKDSYKDIKFIEPKRDSENSNVNFVPTKSASNYDSFPYVMLRLVSAFFGILLAITVYSFIRIVTHSPSAALWGMFFVTFENTILLHSRLILLDTMFLTFALAGITLFLSKRVHPIISGIVFGLALSIKLTAIAFIGIIILAVAHEYTKSKDKYKKLFSPYIKFVVAGFCTLILFLFTINPLMAPVEDRINQYTQILETTAQFDKEAFSNESKYPILRTSFGRNIVMSIIEISSGAAGYVTAAFQYTIHSPWYEWPLRIHELVYGQERNVETGTETKISLHANHVIGALGIAVIIISALFLMLKTTFTDEERNTILLLLGGYVFALLPFGFIERSTYFYHYFPALIFEISLLSYFISIAQRHSKHLISSSSIIIVSIVVMGFIVIAPFTYGIPTLLN